MHVHVCVFVGGCGYLLVWVVVLRFIETCLCEKSTPINTYPCFLGQDTHLRYCVFLYDCVCACVCVCLYLCLCLCVT